MARSILVVDQDIEALGELASLLRARGFAVTISDGGSELVERARSARPDAILLAESLPSVRQLVGALRADGELVGVPRFTIVDAASPRDLSPQQLPRSDLDALVQRLYQLPERAARISPERDDFRGDLQQLGVVDLLQLLMMNQRSGVLSIATPSGAGEVRLASGEIVDAVYRRLEGEKALFRLLSEQEGSFTFAGGKQTAPKRVGGNTSALLMEGIRQLDERRLIESQLALGRDALLAEGHSDAPTTALEESVLRILSQPTGLGELLDELAASDLQILQSLGQLLSRGLVRRVPATTAQVTLTDEEQVPVLAGQLKRLQAPGFGAVSRVVLVAARARLATVAHSLERFVGVTIPASARASTPLPKPIAQLALGDDGKLEILGMSEDETMQPLWALALPGSIAVVRLDEPVGPGLEELCSLFGVPLLDVNALVGFLDEGEPEQVAALLREALQAAASS